MKQLNLENQDIDLFEQVLNLNQLTRAYKAVKANKGAQGIDGIDIEAFGVNLNAELIKLAEEVRKWQYKPLPVRRVRIPKSDGGERLLGIPCVRDRVLQYSLKMTMEPYFEKQFSEHSYGFRPARSQANAIKAAKEIVEQGHHWVVDIDLEKFFDTINHDKIIHLVRKAIGDARILRLIGITLRSGIMDMSEFIESNQGTVQGSPLSPLLSNIVLDELDKELEKRKLKFCRYADDCNIFVRSQKAALRVKESITKFIENRLKLRVNQEKSKAALSQAVKFLGFTIIAGSIVISQKSMARAMDNVDKLTPRRNHIPLEIQIEKINQWYVGWSNYYQVGEYPHQLNRVEAHLRRRLRAQFIRAQKRHRHLLAKYIKLGVPSNLARRSMRGGVWKQSRSNAAHKAWSNIWFKKIGLKTSSDKKLAHWKPLDKRVTFL